MFFNLKNPLIKRITVPGVLLLAVCASSSQAQDEKRQWPNGENLYDKVCGHCHKPEAGVGPAITGRALPAAYIKVFVRNGFNAMPAFPASFIDVESIEQVAEYLSTLPAAPVEQP